MTQTLSPEHTGEIQLVDEPTQLLGPPRLRRPDAEPWRTTDPLPRTIGVVADLTHPDTMPVPPGNPGKTLVPLPPREGYIGRHRDPLDREAHSNSAPGRHVRRSALAKALGR